MGGLRLASKGNEAITAAPFALVDGCQLNRRGPCTFSQENETATGLPVNGKSAIEAGSLAFNDFFKVK